MKVGRRCESVPAPPRPVALSATVHLPFGLAQAPARAHTAPSHQPVEMTDTTSTNAPAISRDRPQPPAPVAESFTALTDNLDQLLTAAETSNDEATASLAAGLHTAALDNLRSIASACGLDWDAVLAERDRRSVVAE